MMRFTLFSRMYHVYLPPQPPSNFSFYSLKYQWNLEMGPSETKNRWGHEGGAPVTGLVALQEEQDTVLFTPCRSRMKWQLARSLLKMELAAISIRDWPASMTLRKRKSLLFKLSNLWYFVIAAQTDLSDDVEKPENTDWKETRMAWLTESFQVIWGWSSSLQAEVPQIFQAASSGTRFRVSYIFINSRLYALLSSL